MQITILTNGSRGDVQPYVALGVGLKRAGHRVRMPAPSIFRDLIAGAGLEYEPVDYIPPQEFLRSPAIQQAVKRGGQFRVMLAMLRNAGPVLQTIFDEFWRTSAGTDLIIANTIPFGGPDCAELRGVPCVFAPLNAVQPTRAFPSPFALFFGLRLHRSVNRMTHRLVTDLNWLLFKGNLNQWRRKMGLAPIPLGGYFQWLNTRRIPTVYGFSTAVLPAPQDWPAWHRVAGYWFLDDPAWQPPADLQRFLDDGPPPVFIGFGSMDNQSPEQLTRVMLEALCKSGQRGVLQAGWAGLGNVALPKTVFRVEDAPHSWLFPRMAAVVHHGGAGTTAAGLRAGVPTVILPVAGDQHFWGERLAQLGAGVRCSPLVQANSDELARAIRQAVETPHMRERAGVLGAAVRAERGVERAVQMIEQAA